jgi:hypothetical protein
MSNPIDTRNLATTAIRRVNARTEPEDLNSEGRFDGRVGKKRGGGQAPVALKSTLDPNTHVEGEALRQLNFAISLMQASMNRIRHLITMAEAGADEADLKGLVQQVVFQQVELPHGDGAKPNLFPVRLEAVEDEEPYTIVLHPIDLQTILAGDFSNLESVRQEYLAHHEWALETLMSRLSSPGCDNLEGAQELSAALCESLANRREAPWDSARFKNATRLLRRSPST